MPTLKQLNLDQRIFFKFSDHARYYLPLTRELFKCTDYYNWAKRKAARVSIKIWRVKNYMIEKTGRPA